jgi:hypothetical protein
MVIKRLAPMAALVFGLAGLSPLIAGNLGPVYIFTESGPCSSNANCSTIFLTSFGTTSWGGSYAPGFNGNAQTAWYEDHFGLLARADGNTTGASGGATAFARGSLFQPVLIPAQAGMALGDPGVFRPQYHLDGSVSIDWGGNNNCSVFYVGCVPTPGAQVSLQWTFASYDNPNGYGTPTAYGYLVQEQWQADHLTASVDRDVTPSMPFRYGETFYYAYEVTLFAGVGSSAPPSVGYAEGDFFHTGTLTGATVLDSFGNPIPNPVIISDSGLGLANSQGTAVPEPASVLLMGGALGALILGCRRFRSN